MYLNRKIYIGASYKYRNVVVKSVDITIDGIPVVVDFSQIEHIEEKVAYWRKAHNIHSWFVENCQDGEDDCRSYYVSQEKMKELYDLCREILNNRKKPKKILAMDCALIDKDWTLKELDEYFFNSVEYTMTTIRKALSATQDGTEYEYRASW